MQYDFWDYLPGFIILSLFFVPFLIAVLANIATVIGVAIAGISGGLQTTKTDGPNSVTVRLNSYDYDEDEY